MKTRILRLDPDEFSPDALEEPARCLDEGGLVVFPTETVYGIGVNLDRPGSVRRLLDLRRSPEDKVLTVHIGDRDRALRLGVVATPVAQRLMSRFWPGPLTIVFPLASSGTVGVRYPSDRVAQALLRQARSRIGAPSANRSGEPPALEAGPAIAAFDGQVEWVIDAGPTQFRKASTVVRAVGRKPEVLREGAIPASMVEEVGYCKVLFVCTGNTCRSPMAAALFRHLAAERLGVEVDGLRERGLWVESAGTAAGSGVPAFDHAFDVMRERGVSLEDHRSQPVTIGAIEDSDHVFVMTRAHRKLLLEWAPDCEDRIALLDPDGEDVRDPMMGAREVYEECARRIDAAMRRRLPEILEGL